MLCRVCRSTDTCFSFRCHIVTSKRESNSPMGHKPIGGRRLRCSFTSQPNPVAERASEHIFIQYLVTSTSQHSQRRTCVARQILFEARATFVRQSQQRAKRPRDEMGDVLASLSDRSRDTGLVADIDK